ncbi:THAP domain-containing protein 9, partial [Aphis craccivora]
NELVNQGRKPTGMTGMSYSKEIKEFALTLNYYKALTYCRYLMLMLFFNVAATSECCIAIDWIFNFLNSKSKFSKGFKSPIFKSNIQTSESIIIPLIKYLYSLKFKGLSFNTSNKKLLLLASQNCSKESCFKKIPCFLFFNLLVMTIDK